MRGLIIGTGAAGNKAVINLVEAGVIAKDDMLLVNSAIKDVPEAYRDMTVILSSDQQGCGKERNKAKDITLAALREGKLNLDAFVQPHHDKAIIVTSTEGGTGCGSSVILAKYIKNVLGMNAEVIGFTGFEEDGRGLRNTIEFFQDLESDYTVQIIKNSAFMKEAMGNKLKAEKLANQELARRVKVTLGLLIKDSTQNIDETDIYKAANTVGYMAVEYIPVKEKIRSRDQFNEILKEAFDNSKSLESAKGMQRLAVILNIREENQDYIDYSFDYIKGRLGNPYESFSHIQDDGEQEFIAVMAAGMLMPVKEVEAIYKRYQEESEKVNKSEDSFFDSVKSLKGNSEDARFDMLKGSNGATSSKDAFFKGFDTVANKDVVVDNSKKRKPTMSASEF